MRTGPAAAPVVLAAVLAAALAACGQDQPRGDPLKGGDAPPPITARPDGLPSGHPPIDQLPPGHPPMTGGGMGAAAGAGAGAQRAPAALTWTVPEGWKESAPSSAMRMAQFDLPGAWPDGGPVQCVLFTAMGGGVQGNVDRWNGQVTGADGAMTKDKKITETTTADGTKVTRVEFRGAFADSMSMSSAPRKSDDALFLGAIVGEGEQVFTVKLAGPRAVVEPETAKFDAFLASLRKK